MRHAADALVVLAACGLLIVFFHRPRAQRDADVVSMEAWRAERDALARRDQIATPTDMRKLRNLTTVGAAYLFGLPHPLVSHDRPAGAPSTGAKVGRPTPAADGTALQEAAGKHVRAQRPRLVPSDI